jgi:protein-tyrosine phosphatase
MDADNYKDVKTICGADWNAGKVDLLLNISLPNQNKNVLDPWYSEEDGYHKVFKMIDEACEALCMIYDV